MVTGSNVQGNGKALGATYEGFALQSGTLNNFASGGVYTMTWYQPPYAATYPAGHLRRYSGNPQNPDMVRPYCVSARNLTSNNKFGVTAGDRFIHGVMAISGATTIAAGVIAYGVASLAF